MFAPIRYFAFHEQEDGPVTGLWRIQDDGYAVWGEVLVDGDWAENQAVLGCLYDSEMATEVTPDQAAALTAQFGGAY